MVPIVVFDTNVIFSAIGWKGRPFACLERARQGAVAIVAVTEQLAGITPDPDDDRVLECAVAAQATYIVTGDRRHLLPLVLFRTIQIISPAAFLTLVPEP